MKSMNPIVRFVLLGGSIILAYLFIDSYLVYKIPFLEHVVNLCYHTILQIVKNCSYFILDAMGYDVRVGCLNYANCYQDVIWIKGSARSVQINHMCLALDVMVYFFALIVAYPGHKRTKPWVILGGWILIQFLNTIRITWLTITMYKRPEAFDFEHHVVFRVVVFTILFIVWALWIKYFPEDRDEKKKAPRAV